MKAIHTLVVGLLMVQVVAAEVKTETVPYEHNGQKLQGFLAYDDKNTGKRPGVLIVHEWWGLNAYAKDRAKQIAQLGYVAFCVDMYGDGKTTDHPEEAGKMAAHIRENLAGWRGRAEAGLQILKRQPNVEPTKLAAIGYCFGGTTCLQLAYAGADLKAVATFHAGLVTPDEATAKKIQPRILVCHGADDAFIPAKSIEEFKATLTKAGTKYDFVAYPKAVHSFTVPDADQKRIPGIAYNKAADDASWSAMKKLFEETLQ
jgi:dienelactone hydrolase